jgi:hypothetical protein
MLVREFLGIAYKSGKNGLTKLAINFMVKHNLKEDMDVREDKLILLSQHLSNKEKRIEIITLLLKNMSIKSQGEAVVNKKTSVGTWRNSNYKQIAKELHPDSDTGCTEAFQFLQEVKEFLWDYKGVPKTEIKYWSWKEEREYRENGGFGYGFTNTK